MELAMEKCEPDNSIEGIEAQLADFHAKRKEYHRLEILKQKYLDSWNKTNDFHTFMLI